MNDLKEINIFISYAHEDKDTWLPSIKKCLNFNKNQNVNIWDDGLITLGKDWDSVIKQRLDTADIILLLVSRDFILSEYINREELSRAFERHHRGECCVVPLMVRNCSLDKHPDIKAVKYFPEDKFFSDMDNEIDKYFTMFENEIKRVIADIRTNHNFHAGVADVSNSGKQQQMSAREIIDENNTSGKLILISNNPSARRNECLQSLLREVSKMNEIEDWPFNIEVCDYRDAAIQQRIREATYVVHIYADDAPNVLAAETAEFNTAASCCSDSYYKKQIVWAVAGNVTLPEYAKTARKISGNKPVEFIRQIEEFETERQEVVDCSKDNFSQQINLYMIYDFAKDHENDKRVALKKELERRSELINFFMPPGATFSLDLENELKRCKGTIIFYGNASNSWYCYWQSEIQKLNSLKRSAICVRDPGLTIKIERDVNVTAFHIMENEDQLSQDVDQFITQLRN